MNELLQNFWFQCGGVFVSIFAMDFVWAKWTLAIGEKRAALSSHYSALLIVLSGVGAIGYTSNPWLLVPAVAGAWGGTYLSLRHSR